MENLVAVSIVVCVPCPQSKVSAVIATITPLYFLVEKIGGTMFQKNKSVFADRENGSDKFETLLLRAYEIAEVKGYTMYPVARKAILDQIAKIEESGDSIEDYHSEFEAIGRDVRDPDTNWSGYLSRVYRDR